MNENIEILQRQFDAYCTKVLKYVTQENGRAKMGDVLYTGTPEKCRELMGQLKSGELTEGDIKQLYAKAQETAKTAEPDKDTFSIYQIKGGDETRDLRFEPYDRLQAAGNVVDRANYELVYSAPLAPGTSLEDIYTRFNIDHPKDFKGHSLSVSDVVVLHQDGQDAAHYVDSAGFRQVPEFLQEQKQLWDTSQQAIFNRRAAAREGENTEVGTRFLCLLRMFLSFRLLSPTTEKKRFCQTYAKEKRCNLKKDYNAF